MRLTRIERVDGAGEAGIAYEDRGRGTGVKGRGTGEEGRETGEAGGGG